MPGDLVIPTANAPIAAAAPWSIPRLLKRLRPSAVLLNDFVDLVHQALGASKCGDNLSVVVDVIIGENSAFPVLKPFLRWPVTPDGEPSSLRRDSLEVLITVDEHSARFSIGRRHIPHLVNSVVPHLREGWGLSLLLLHQMQKS